MAIFLKRGGLLLLLSWLLVGCDDRGATYSDYRLTGVVQYQDKEYNYNGFTGNEPYRPLRYAQLDLINGDGDVIAYTTTDEQGGYQFDFGVSEESVTIRVLSATDTTFSGMNIQVKDTGNYIYAVTQSINLSDNALVHNVAIPTSHPAGGAFNIFDVYVTAHHYVADLAQGGVDLGQLNVFWKAGGSYTCWGYMSGGCENGAGIYVYNGSSDTDEYDDDVLWHEFWHYIELRTGMNDSPGGAHGMGDNTLDLRLSWSEGYGDYFPVAIKNWLLNTGQSEKLSLPVGEPVSRYVDTNSAGYLLHFDFEAPFSSFLYASNEFAVGTLMWGFEATYGGQAVWDVAAHYQPTVNLLPEFITLETFWDGWVVQQGSSLLVDYESILLGRQVNYRQDTSELTLDHAWDTVTRTPVPCSVGCNFSEGHTLYGMGDVDYIPIAITSGLTYTIKTQNLTNGADTYLRLLDSNGIEIAVNDDALGAACGDYGQPACANDGSLMRSEIVYMATYTGTLYVEVSNSPVKWIGAGNYGGYFINVAAQ